MSRLCRLPPPVAALFCDEFGVEIYRAGRDKVRMKRKRDLCSVAFEYQNHRQRSTGTENGMTPSKVARPSSLRRVFMFAKSVPLSGLPPTDDHPFSGCETMATQKLLSDLPSQQSHGIKNYTKWHAKLDHSIGRAYAMNSLCVIHKDNTRQDRQTDR